MTREAPLEIFLIAYSESDFTNPHEAMLPDEPADGRGKFTHMGAQYWGFESRRHKSTSVLLDQQAFAYDHDAHGWMLAGLRQRALVRRVALNTRWFTGNQVQEASVILRDTLDGAQTRVLDRVPLSPDSDHVFDIAPVVATECLVECYSDGGLAQLRLYGDATAQQLPEPQSLLDDASISHVSNAHYGKPDQAVRGNRVELHMVGWESARSGFGEQALFTLARPATVREVIVDTYLHRLNPPLACYVFGLALPAGGDIEAQMAQSPGWKVVFDDGREIVPGDLRQYMHERRFIEDGARRFTIRLHHDLDGPWKAILPFAPLHADRYHRFAANDVGPVTHVLYMHFPNGGIHGLKMLGETA